MSNEIAIGESKFDFNLFCRYIYGGFLLSVMEIIIFKDKAIGLYTYLGKDLAIVFLFTVTILAVGTGFYVAYKTLVSEWFIDSIHLKYPHFMFMHSPKQCALAYFEEFTEKDNIIAAFRRVRDSELFDKTIAKMFYKRHSEIHVLYQTATIFFICAISILFRTGTYSIKDPFLIFACLFILYLMLGIQADKNLCKDEAAYFNCFDNGKVKDILNKARLLKVKTETKQL